MGQRAIGLVVHRHRQTDLRFGGIDCVSLFDLYELGLPTIAQFVFGLLLEGKPRVGRHAKRRLGEGGQ